ncbi:hypothetical protein N7495_001850 [Penicillium taxi]|uniref:uncharacterized protein n=1 Tax=Penicillium taxi TaxID=168475 RepID=UPI002545600F|nr:uncharacterized protein N7495_001850 [Penicillium taxi]KAJ5909168.1 hypothetical protein N7495_001850 [Penicillium taxi]
MSQHVQPARNSHLQTTTETSRESSVVRLTGTLRLRGDDTPSTSTEPARRIRWSEDVVDNEGMGRKSSKVCCIYHKARPVGESSSESESDSSTDSDSDGESDSGRARPSHSHSHSRGRQPSRDHPSEQSSEQTGTCCSEHNPKKRQKRKPSPNAYEKMPKPSKNPSRST